MIGIAFISTTELDPFGRPKTWVVTFDAEEHQNITQFDVPSGNYDIKRFDTAKWSELCTVANDGSELVDLLDEDGKVLKTVPRKDLRSDFTK